MEPTRSDKLVSFLQQAADAGDTTARALLFLVRTDPPMARWVIRRLAKHGRVRRWFVRLALRYPRLFGRKGPIHRLRMRAIPIMTNWATSSQQEEHL